MPIGRTPAPTCGSEEKDLKERFGVQYDEYAANVGGWIPRCSPYDAGLLQV